MLKDFSERPDNRTEQQGRQRAVWLKGLTLGLSLLLLLALLVPSFRARVVMKASSGLAFYQSGLAEAGLDLSLPLVEGWFPELLFYRDPQGLKVGGHGPLDLSIFYTFGAFEGGRSSVYTPGSGYYSSFYGAYVVRGKDVGEIPETALLEDVAAYDYETLILGGLGYPNPRGAFEVWDSIRTGIAEGLGVSDWDRFEVRVRLPGMAHQKEGWRLHYWQFGAPPPLGKSAPFEPVVLSGRLYARTFGEENVTVILYMLCESEAVLAQVEAAVLAEGQLVIKSSR